ncbi:MAG: hypothetical protein MJ209_07745 [archaeon]|nr:hypothetical protein [archaeon]
MEVKYFNKILNIILVCGGTEDCSSCICPICNIILGYNIFLRSPLTCRNCSGHPLLLRVTVKEYQCIRGSDYFPRCSFCECELDILNKVIYSCFNCGFNVCNRCSLLYQSVFNLTTPPLLNAKELMGEEETKGNNSTQQKLENLKCSVCMKSDKCIVFMPCTHMACCEECSNSIDECPICHQKIEEKIKAH